MISFLRPVPCAWRVGVTQFSATCCGSGGAVPAIVPLAVSCRTAIALGVVLLMTVKSGLTESVAVVVIAVAAGLIHGIVTRNVPRAVPSLGGIEKGGIEKPEAL